jgi:hypothetical protein
MKIQLSGKSGQLPKREVQTNDSLAIRKIRIVEKMFPINLSTTN